MTKERLMEPENSLKMHLNNYKQQKGLLFFSVGVLH